MELRKSRRLLEVLVGAAAEKEGKRKRREKGRDVLTPILWNHKRHLLTVCLCHCVRLHGGDDDGRQIYRGRSGVAGGGRPRQHQLRRRDFAAAEARTFALADIVRAEILRPRRSTSLPGGFGGGIPPLYSTWGRHYYRGDAVVFRSYAPAVFRAMRAAMDIDQSISPESEPVPFLQYVSSKSKRSLLFTYDRRFILKLEKKSSIKRLMEMLEDYIGHFIASPHSLIVKILGVYSIKIGKSKTSHILVMQSIFWPSSQIKAKFDLKGCLAGRTVKERERKVEEDQDDQVVEVFGEEDFLVLKDGNFVGTDVNFGGSSRWLAEQLSRDVSFLRDLGVVDYSLLLGIQPLVQSDPSANTTDKRNTSKSRRNESDVDQVELDEEEARRAKANYYAHFASAIKRSSLGFVGASASASAAPYSSSIEATAADSAPSTAPPSAQLQYRNRRTVAADVVSSHSADPRDRSGRARINIADLADYMDVTEDGTILVNENGHFDDSFLDPSDEEALSVLASEILEESPRRGRRQQQQLQQQQHRKFPSYREERQEMKKGGESATSRSEQQPRRLRVKQVKFHRSVDVLDFEEDSDGIASSRSASSTPSPTPSLQFQVHPVPKDLPTSPPPPHWEDQYDTSSRRRPPSSSSSLGIGGGGGGGGGSTSSRLNLRLLLPGGGGGGGRRVEPLPVPPPQPPPLPLPPMSPSPYPLTPLIQEAEEEEEERSRRMESRRNITTVMIRNGGSSRRKSYKQRAPPVPSDRFQQQQHRQQQQQQQQQQSSSQDPDLIEPAPGNFPDSAPFSASLFFNWRQFPPDLLGGPDNRRLLPDSANGVHVVDGPAHRYYLGIVDILGRHSTARAIAGWMRTVWLCDGDHSTSAPDAYAERFREFMLDHL